MIQQELVEICEEFSLYYEVLEGEEFYKLSMYSVNRCILL